MPGLNVIEAVNPEFDEQIWTQCARGLWDLLPETDRTGGWGGNETSEIGVESVEDALDMDLIEVLKDGGKLLRKAAPVPEDSI